MGSSSDQNSATIREGEPLSKLPLPISMSGPALPLIPGTMIDGYELIRPIGRGGFGTVWLVRSVVTGSLQALKYVRADDSRLLEKELQALEKFKRAASRLSSMHIVPIEHVNCFGAGVVYVMPLADGMSPVDPVDESWVPDTLAARIDAQRDRATWFDSKQIVEWFTPLIEAVAELTDLGLVHRDIKPENVLFINGRPCLGDISLLTDDAATVSQRGTPGYVAPSWYLSSGGHPDLWGLASTFFALLSGNPPDRIGRAAFLWPPQGISSMDKAQQQEWSYFHSLTLRATCETPSERFPQIRDFAAALSTMEFEAGRQPKKRPLEHYRRHTLMIGIGLILAVVAALMVQRFPHVKNTSGLAGSSLENGGLSTSEASTFDKQVAETKEEFEKVLKEGEAKFFLYSSLHVEKFQGMLENLTKQEAASMQEIERTCMALKDLAPKLRAEITPPNDKEWNPYYKRLYAIAMRPDEIASNPDQSFRVKKLVSTLEGRSTEFFNRANEVATVLIWKEDALRTLIDRTFEALREERMKQEAKLMKDYENNRSNLSVLTDEINRLTKLQRLLTEEIDWRISR